MFKLFIFLGIFFILALTIEGIGFPSGGGGGGCCCGGGGGGGGGGCGGCGGGCGRKKREIAVQPHFKSGDDIPCPQAEWKEIMEEALVVDDAIGSVGAIQSGLYRRFEAQKFLVICGAAGIKKVEFSSSGDGYCSVVKNGIWCQAAALVA